MTSFLSGIRYFLSGFSLMMKPGLKRYTMLPLLISVIFFIGFYLLLQHYLFLLNHFFLSYLPSWLQWMSIVLWLIFLISYLLVLIYAFVMIANIVAAPFNGLLAEKVAIYLTKKESVSRTLRENIYDVPRMIGRQLKMFFYTIPRAGLLLLLFAVPFIQPFVAFFWILFNAQSLSLAYLDYPADYYRISFDELKIWIKQNRSISLGFGSSVLLFSIIPVLNIFTLPAAVAAATHLWIAESSGVNKKFN